VAAVGDSDVQPIVGGHEGAVVVTSKVGGGWKNRVAVFGCQINIIRTNK
jgi:hypothetical protein